MNTIKHSKKYSKSTTTVEIKVSMRRMELLGRSPEARRPRFENHLHSAAATSTCSVIGNNEIKKIKKKRLFKTFLAANKQLSLKHQYGGTIENVHIEGRQVSTNVVL